MIQLTESRKRVKEAIAEIHAGNMVIMVDDEDRENEGDLVFAADDVSPEKVNFMATHARGLICLSLASEISTKLDLLPVKNSQNARKSTAFTNSIEARQGVTTGISAADRAQTIKVAIDQKSQPSDLVTPGHVFPLVARDGGVLERAGHTEGSVDLVRLSDKKPAAVICEIMNEDGTMSRRDDLEKFSKKFNLKIVSVADIVAYRLEKDNLIDEISSKEIQHKNKTFYFSEIFSEIDGQVHYVLSTHKKFSKDDIVDVRVHRQNPKKDVLDTFLNEGPFYLGLKMLEKSEKAVFTYLNSNNTSSIQPTLFKAYGLGAQILRHLNINKMHVYTRSEIKFGGLDSFGLKILDTKQLEG